MIYKQVIEVQASTSTRSQKFTLLNVVLGYSTIIKAGLDEHRMRGGK
jgi:hypothetical protein